VCTSHPAGTEGASAPCSDNRISEDDKFVFVQFCLFVRPLVDAEIPAATSRRAETFAKGRVQFWDS